MWSEKKYIYLLQNTLLDKFAEYFMYFQNAADDSGCIREVVCNLKLTA